MDQNLELALQQVIVDDEGNIFVEPICKFFGINFKNQKERIIEDPILQSEGGKKYHELSFGDKRLRLCLGRRGFIRWIQIINPAIVRPELRKLFVQYQIAVFDYLYIGNESKNAQLEDIRKYAENINNAIVVNRQVMEYIAEQKQHRDLCLALSPNEWVRIKGTLTEEKILPQTAGKMKAIGSTLPNDIEELQRMKKSIQWNIISNRNKLTHQRINIKGHPENPMPEGYPKEKIKLAIKSQEERLEIVNDRIIEISKKQLENKQPVEILKSK